MPETIVASRQTGVVRAHRARSDSDDSSESREQALQIGLVPIRPMAMPLSSSTVSKQAIRHFEEAEYRKLQTLIEIYVAEVAVDPRFRVNRGLRRFLEHPQAPGQAHGGERRDQEDAGQEPRPPRARVILGFGAKYVPGFKRFVIAAKVGCPLCPDFVLLVRKVLRAFRAEAGDEGLPLDEWSDLEALRHHLLVRHMLPRGPEDDEDGAEEAGEPLGLGAPGGAAAARIKLVCRTNEADMCKLMERRSDERLRSWLTDYDPVNWEPSAPATGPGQGARVIRASRAAPGGYVSGQTLMEDGASRSVLRKLYSQV